MSSVAEGLQQHQHHQESPPVLEHNQPVSGKDWSSSQEVPCERALPAVQHSCPNHDLQVQWQQHLHRASSNTTLLQHATSDKPQSQATAAVVDATPAAAAATIGMAAATAAAAPEAAAMQPSAAVPGWLEHASAADGAAAAAVTLDSGHHRAAAAAGDPAATLGSPFAQPAAQQQADMLAQQQQRRLQMVEQQQQQQQQQQQLHHHRQQQVAQPVDRQPVTTGPERVHEHPPGASAGMDGPWQQQQQQVLVRLDSLQAPSPSVQRTGSEFTPQLAEEKFRIIDNHLTRVHMEIQRTASDVARVRTKLAEVRQQQQQWGWVPQQQQQHQQQVDVLVGHHQALCQRMDSLINLQATAEHQRQCLMDRVLAAAAAAAAGRPGNGAQSPRTTTAASAGYIHPLHRPQQQLGVLRSPAGHGPADLGHVLPPAATIVATPFQRGQAAADAAWGSATPLPSVHPTPQVVLRPLSPLDQAQPGCQDLGQPDPQVRLRQPPGQDASAQPGTNSLIGQVASPGAAQAQLGLSGLPLQQIELSSLAVRFRKLLSDLAAEQPNNLPLRTCSAVLPGTAAAAAASAAAAAGSSRPLLGLRRSLSCPQLHDSSQVSLQQSHAGARQLHSAAAADQPSAFFTGIGGSRSPSSDTLKAATVTDGTVNKQVQQQHQRQQQWPRSHEPADLAGDTAATAAAAAQTAEQHQPVHAVLAPRPHTAPAIGKKVLDLSGKHAVAASPLSAAGALEQDPSSRSVSADVAAVEPDTVHCRLPDPAQSQQQHQVWYDQYAGMVPLTPAAAAAVDARPAPWQSLQQQQQQQKIQQAATLQGCAGTTSAEASMLVQQQTPGAQPAGSRAAAPGVAAMLAMQQTTAVLQQQQPQAAIAAVAAGGGRSLTNGSAVIDLTLSGSGSLPVSPRAVAAGIKRKRSSSSTGVHVAAAAAVNDVDAFAAHPSALNSPRGFTKCSRLGQLAADAAAAKSMLSEPVPGGTAPSDSAATAAAAAAYSQQDHQAQQLAALQQQQQQHAALTAAAAAVHSASQLDAVLHNPPAAAAAAAAAPLLTPGRTNPAETGLWEFHRLPMPAAAAAAAGSQTVLLQQHQQQQQQQKLRILHKLLLQRQQQQQLLELQHQQFALSSPLARDLLGPAAAGFGGLGALSPTTPGLNPDLQLSYALNPAGGGSLSPVAGLGSGLGLAGPHLGGLEGLGLGPAGLSSPGFGSVSLPGLGASALGPGDLDPGLYNRCLQGLAGPSGSNNRYDLGVLASSARGLPKSRSLGFSAQNPQNLPGSSSSSGQRQQQQQRLTKHQQAQAMARKQQQIADELAQFLDPDSRELLQQQHRRELLTHSLLPTGPGESPSAAAVDRQESAEIMGNALRLLRVPADKVVRNLSRSGMLADGSAAAAGAVTRRNSGSSNGNLLRKQQQQQRRVIRQQQQQQSSLPAVLAPANAPGLPGPPGSSVHRGLAPAVLPQGLASHQLNPDQQQVSNPAGYSDDGLELVPHDDINPAGFINPEDDLAGLNPGLHQDHSDRAWSPIMFQSRSTLRLDQLGSDARLEPDLRPDGSDQINPTDETMIQNTEAATPAAAAAGRNTADAQPQPQPQQQQQPPPMLPGDTDALNDGASPAAAADAAAASPFAAFASQPLAQPPVESVAAPLPAINSSMDRPQQQQQQRGEPVLPAGWHKQHMGPTNTPAGIEEPDYARVSSGAVGLCNPPHGMTHGYRLNSQQSAEGIRPCHHHQQQQHCYGHRIGSYNLAAAGSGGGGSGLMGSSAHGRQQQQHDPRMISSAASGVGPSATAAAGVGGGGGQGVVRKVSTGLVNMTDIMPPPAPAAPTPAPPAAPSAAAAVRPDGPPLQRVQCSSPGSAGAAAAIQHLKGVQQQQQQWRPVAKVLHKPSSRSAARARPDRRMEQQMANGKAPPAPAAAGGGGGMKRKPSTSIRSPATAAAAVAAPEQMSTADLAKAMHTAWSTEDIGLTSVLHEDQVDDLLPMPRKPAPAATAGFGGPDSQAEPGQGARTGPRTANSAADIFGSVYSKENRQQLQAGNIQKLNQEKQQQQQQSPVAKAAVAKKGKGNGCKGRAKGRKQQSHTKEQQQQEVEEKCFSGTAVTTAAANAAPSPTLDSSAPASSAKLDNARTSVQGRQAHCVQGGNPSIKATPAAATAADHAAQETRVDQQRQQQRNTHMSDDSTSQLKYGSSGCLGAHPHPIGTREPALLGAAGVAAVGSPSSTAAAVPSPQQQQQQRMQKRPLAGNAAAVEESCLKSRRASSRAAAAASVAAAVMAAQASSGSSSSDEDDDSEFSEQQQQQHVVRVCSPRCRAEHIPVDKQHQMHYRSEPRSPTAAATPGTAAAADMAGGGTKVISPRKRQQVLSILSQVMPPPPAAAAGVRSPRAAATAAAATAAAGGSSGNRCIIRLKKTGSGVPRTAADAAAGINSPKAAAAAAAAAAAPQRSATLKGQQQQQQLLLPKGTATTTSDVVQEDPLVKCLAIACGLESEPDEPDASGSSTRHSSSTITTATHNTAAAAPGPDSKNKSITWSPSPPAAAAALPAAQQQQQQCCAMCLPHKQRMHLLLTAFLSAGQPALTAQQLVAACRDLRARLAAAAAAGLPTVEKRPGCLLLPNTDKLLKQLLLGMPSTGNLAAAAAAAAAAVQVPVDACSVDKLFEMLDSFSSEDTAAAEAEVLRTLQQDQQEHALPATAAAAAGKVLDLAATSSSGGSSSSSECKCSRHPLFVRVRNGFVAAAAATKTADGSSDDDQLAFRSSDHDQDRDGSVLDRWMLAPPVNHAGDLQQHVDACTASFNSHNHHLAARQQRMQQQYGPVLDLMFPDGPDNQAASLDDAVPESQAEGTAVRRGNEAVANAPKNSVPAVAAAAAAGQPSSRSRANGSKQVRARPVLQQQTATARQPGTAAAAAAVDGPKLKKLKGGTTTTPAARSGAAAAAAAACSKRQPSNSKPDPSTDNAAAAGLLGTAFPAVKHAAEAAADTQAQAQ